MQTVCPAWKTCIIWKCIRKQLENVSLSVYFEVQQKWSHAHWLTGYPICRGNGCMFSEQINRHRNDNLFKYPHCWSTKITYCLLHSRQHVSPTTFDSPSNNFATSRSFNFKAPQAFSSWFVFCEPLFTLFCFSKCTAMRKASSSL